MNRANKNQAVFQKIKYFKNQSIKKYSFFKMGLLVQYSLVKKKLEGVDQHLKMTSKIRISRCSRRLLIILMSLTVTLFSEKKITTCTRGILNCLYPTPFKAKINHCFCVSKFRRSSATQNKPCYQTLGRIAFLQG